MECSAKKSKARIANIGIKVLEWFRLPATEAFKASKHFNPPAHIEDLANSSKMNEATFTGSLFDI